MDRTRYQRFFHMLREEDKGYGISGACNGYVKIEIKDGKAKLQTFAQNLRELDKGTSYAVYFIKAGDISALPIRMGILEMQKNKGELVTQFDPDSIKNSGMPIEKIGAFTITLERGSLNPGNVICPLAACIDDKIDWRTAFRNITVQKQVPERKPEPVFIERYARQPDTPAEAGPLDSKPQDIRSVVEAGREDISTTVPELQDISSPEELRRDVHHEQNTVGEPASEIKSELVTDNRAEIKKPGESEANLPEDRDRVYINDPAIKNMQAEADSKVEVNMLERVKEALGRHFEEFQPFQRRRFSYRWWKVSNPVYLNNILYLNRVKSPIFFNPLVIMAHFKHKHIIMGVYDDRQNDKEYIVCGTPGIYGIDERPFGELCRWMPKEGERPRYGGYGYWVVYIDPSTGRLVTI